MPEEQHADQDEGGGNNIPDKVHPMDALTATEPVVFVIDIKTTPHPFSSRQSPAAKIVGRNLSMRPGPIAAILSHLDQTFEEFKNFRKLPRTNWIIRNAIDKQSLVNRDKLCCRCKFLCLHN